MPFEIKSHDDLIIVPTHILHNPRLSLDAKGAAGVMYSYGDLHCTTVELAKLFGVDEKRTKELIRELQNAGYENIFHLSEETEINDQATARCAANLKNC